uniref:Uncharacterized protein n=1 Tax=Anguilla anguilla TaxID=7936 RepID=A0A0E9QMF4_ANGAN
MPAMVYNVIYYDFKFTLLETNYTLRQAVS